MSRPAANAAVSVERFFQFSLWGLVTSGYLAVAGSGFLDTPTVALVGAGLLLRALQIAGVVRLVISPALVTALTLVYIGFFPLDYLFLSRAFVNATVHLVFFLAVIKILTSSTYRDYLFTATIAFLELLAAAILSTNSNFFLFLALYLLFAMAAFTSSEIRRSLQRPHVVARSGLRRFYPRLGALTAIITLGILTLTAGLFFMLPRTADAAFRHMVAKRFYLPGFSNEVTLGEIGEIKATSRPVMHVRFFDRNVPANLKWRGGALSEFNGKSWFEPSGDTQFLLVDRGHLQLARDEQRRRLGRRTSYRVSLNGIDADALFFAGIPETIDIKQPMLLAGGNGTLRLSRPPAEGSYYDVYSYLGGPESSAAESEFLSSHDRRRYLQLPRTLDARIPELARAMTEGYEPDARRARAIEQGLRRGYGYTLDLPQHEVADPLAYFLFERKKGHCEYFASAMTIMLRTQGIPARLVTGFQSGIWNPLTELYVIRASDAHSWVEAWLADRGWVTFDPTPPDPNPAGLSLLTKLALYADAVETFWQEWVVSYDLGHQVNLADRMEQASRSASVRWLGRVADLAANWEPRAEYWLRHYGWWSLAALAGGALGAWSGLLLWRLGRVRLGVRRLGRGKVSLGDATLLYHRMLKLLKRRGYQKPDWFTPCEFANSLPVELGVPVMEFTAAYNALRFGGQAKAAQQLSVLLERLERQRG